MRYYFSAFFILLFVFFTYSSISTAKQLPPPAVPVLLSPADGATSQPTNPTFLWNAITGAVDYHLQVATDNLFSSLVIDAYFADTSYGASGLLNNATYYWRVLARDLTDSSAYSAAFSFSTVLATPTLTTPSNNALGIPLTPSFTWSAVAGATNYRFQLSTDAGFSSFEADDIVGTPSHSVGPLAYNTQYFWRVYAYNATDSSGFSSTSNYYTKMMTPVLATPADLSRNLNTSVTLKWFSVSGASDYTVQIATDAGFSNIIENAAVTDTQHTKTGLAYGTEYYWRVKAYSATLNYGDFSGGFYFKTKLAAPLLMDPPNNLTAASRFPIFSWSVVTGATQYRLQLSTDIGFASFIHDTVIAGNSLTGDTLPYNTVYYWRVYAQNALDSSSFSSVFTFITIMDTPVLSSPANGAQNVNVSVQLKWNAVPGADFYIFKLADDPGMLNILQTSTPADSHITLSGLTHWKQYYWCVWAQSNYPNTSVGSSDFSFKTRLAPPVLHSPASGAEGVSIQPVLKWRTVNGAVTYELQVSNTNTFATLLIDSTGITDTTFNVYPYVFANGTDYYWRIRAVNAVSQSFYSARVFTTVAEIYPYLAHPINGDLVYSLTPSLFWYINVAPGAIQYDVMYSVDGSFPNALTVIADAGPEINYTIPTPLLPDTKYYWKVRSKYLPDVIVRYSVRDSFMTFGAAVPPMGDWPKDSAAVYTYTPELTWSMDRPYPSYTYEYRYKINSAPDWEDTVAVGAALKHTLPTLIPGAYYSWQVRSHNGNVYSAWSSVYEFTVSTNLAASAVVPVPLYPSAGTTVYTTAPVFNWSVAGTSLGLTFELEVRTDSLFTGVATDVDLTGLYYQKVGLLSGTTYYWKVRSKLHGVYSAWSSFEYFTTAVSGAISDPVLIYPIDSISVYISRPYLLWYSAAHSASTTYDVEYRAADTNFSLGSALVLGLPLGVYEMPNLDPATMYYWRARAHNGVLSTAWTEPEAFYVVDPQGSLTPQIIYPTGAVVTADSAVQILWYVNHGHLNGYTYDVEVSLTNSFTGVPTAAGLDFNVYNFTGASGTQYYFRVRTHNGGYTSAWSAPETFVTPVTDAPARPAVGSPANNVKLFSASPVVSWYVPASPAASLRYDVEYSDKADFSNAVKISGVQKKFTALSNLVTGKTYYWRVRGKNTDGVYSRFSGSGVFRVESPTEAAPDAAIPGVFALEQNYPNPFNPATTIKYSIAEKSNVRLAVFDMLGREVALLVNGEQLNGSYSIEFNAAKLASGVYFYKLQAGNSVLTKKFVILK